MLRCKKYEFDPCGGSNVCMIAGLDLVNIWSESGHLGVPVLIVSDNHDMGNYSAGLGICVRIGFILIFNFVTFYTYLFSEKSLL